MWPARGQGPGLFFLTSAVLAFLGGVFQINPIWIYGPFDPAQVSAASQPDWYTGWLDALRIGARLGAPGGGVRGANPFFPGVLLAGLTMAVPRGPGDRRPRRAPPARPSPPAPGAHRLGAATITFYVICFLGGAADVLASTFGLSVNAILWTFRVLVLALPPVVGWVVYRLCRELSARDGVPTACG